MTDDAVDPALVQSRRTLSGLEFFRQMSAGRLKPPPMVTLLGLAIAEVEEGRIVITGTATEQFYNGLGIAHGGFAATLLDTALGCAVNTTQPAGRVFTTLELKINYTRPLTREAGELRCEAHVVHVGSRTATAEARIVDSRGKIYAHATTTCIVA
jgi:uncharacterized protein (TIGR00369 family)